MLNLDKKKELIERLNKDLLESEISILVDYKGLNVEKINQLRSELKEKEAKMEVVKNTLLERASDGTDSFVLNEFYKGPNAIVYSKKDPIAPAKILIKFAKDNESLKIKAGALNGKQLDFEAIKQLSQLPSKEELIGKLVFTINAIPTSLVNVLSGVPRSFVNVLNAIKDKKEAA